MAMREYLVYSSCCRGRCVKRGEWMDLDPYIPKLWDAHVYEPCAQNVVASVQRDKGVFDGT